MSKLDPNLIKKLQGKVGKPEKYIREQISKRASQQSVNSEAILVKWAKDKGITCQVYFKKLSPEIQEQVRGLSRRSIGVTNDKKSIKSKLSSISQRIITKNIDLPFGSSFLSAANRNATIYPHVFILENTLRRLIINTFKDENNWWSLKVKDDVQNYAKSIQEAEKKHDWLPKRGNHPIYYVGLEQLFSIISRNYTSYFKNIFTDFGNLQTWIKETVPIRNLLAHNISIVPEEIQVLKIKVKYICTQIENNFT